MNLELHQEVKVTRIQEKQEMEFHKSRGIPAFAGSDNYRMTIRVLEKGDSGLRRNLYGIIKGSLGT